MRKLVLYADRPKVPGTSFKGCKKHVVPDQSLSLSEILRRFVRHEALNISKEGTYAETDYDLEKVAASDPVDKEVVLEQVKQNTARAKAKMEADIAEENKKRVPPTSPPVATGSVDPNPPVIPPKQP